MSGAPHEILTANDLHALLAHRYPFLLVDRIEIIDAGHHVIGRKQLSSGEWWASGANAPAAIPHGLVIEALAQTTGALVRDLVGGTPGAVAYFLGVDRARLRRPARAGDELRLDVTLRQWRRGICRARGRATVDGALVASADLTIIVRP